MISSLSYHTYGCTAADIKAFFDSVPQDYEPTEPVVPPVAGFTASDTSVDTNTAVSFDSSISTGSQPLTYNWNFGDGTANSTQANPSHTFSAAGNYTVILTTTNDAGSNSTTEEITVSAAASGTSGSFASIASLIYSTTEVIASLTNLVIAIVPMQMTVIVCLMVLGILGGVVAFIKD